MMNVGIFGANGFIGRHLTRLLVTRGYRPVCFGRHFPPDFIDAFAGAVEMRLIDLRDDLETHTKLLGVTHVVQLINSTNASLGNSRVVADIQNNLVPHVSFISSCLMSGVRSFTFLSSGGTVYGRPAEIPIAEDHPTRPLNSYGVVKLATEQYMQMLCRDQGMGYNILRAANPFGPGQTGSGGQGLIGTALRRHAQGLPVTIMGEGDAVRDYLYVEDVADAIVRAIAREPTDTAINIGSGIGRSSIEVLAALERTLGTTIVREHVAGRATDVPANVLCIKRARKMLGWAPSTAFEEGLARTIAWSRQQPDVSGAG